MQRSTKRVPTGTVPKDFCPQMKRVSNENEKD
jgi:hypothetical protein